MPNPHLGYFLITYSDEGIGRVTGIDEEPILYGILVKAIDVVEASDEAHKWAAKMSDDHEAEIEILKVTRINGLEDLEKYPEIFLKDEEN